MQALIPHPLLRGDAVPPLRGQGVPISEGHAVHPFRQLLMAGGESEESPAESLEAGPDPAGELLPSEAEEGDQSPPFLPPDVAPDPAIRTESPITGVTPPVVDASLPEAEAEVGEPRQPMGLALGHSKAVEPPRSLPLPVQGAMLGRSLPVERHDHVRPLPLRGVEWAAPLPSTASERAFAALKPGIFVPAASAEATVKVHIGAIGSAGSMPLPADNAHLPFAADDPLREIGSPSQALRSARQMSEPDVPRQITSQLVAMVQVRKSGVADIRLSPEELGRVQLRLSPTDHGVAVQIIAERADTGDLIRRNVDLLIAQLRQEGFDHVDVAFATPQRDGSGRNPAFSTSRSQEGTSPAQPLAESGDETHILLPLGQLDLKL